MVVKIVDVKEKGELMVLHVQDDEDATIDFFLSIDKTVDEATVFDHINASIETINKKKLELIENPALTSKWKDKEVTEATKIG